MSCANGKGAGRRRRSRALLGSTAGLLGVASAGAVSVLAQVPPIDTLPGVGTSITVPAAPTVTAPAPGTTATIAPGSTITVPASATGQQQPSATGEPATRVSADTPLPVGTGFNTLGPPAPRARPRLLRPFPIVRIAGRLTRTGARIRVLSVRAPRGARVLALCSGRGCPRRASSAIVRARSTRTGRVRFGRLQRSLRAGARIQVFVTSPTRIGKYTRFTIRRGLAPKRLDACLAPRGSGRRRTSCR